jgi:thiosulfate dehydrogenase [quinone] large subunit
MPSLPRVALVLLRTLIGWHLVYEGLYKLMLPGWTRAGQPVNGFSAAGYLNAATGPLADVFRSLAQSTWLGAVNAIVPTGLLLVGLSLTLGLLTQAGCLGAMAFLALFYLSAIPTSGMPQPGAEGAYLIVSKNLIELVAVLVIFSFRTGQIAGLDVLRWANAETAAADSPPVPLRRTAKKSDVNLSE